jgi:two-component system, LuxR family, response regulator FixJ
MTAPQQIVHVIDDDEAVRSALRLLFKSVSLPVHAWASAQEFLAQYRDDQPGCIVADVRMPGMSGLELQQALNMRGAITPIIFITGHGDVAMAVDAMRHGAYDFLTKPVRDQDLLDRVQGALQKDAANRQSLVQAHDVRQRLQTLTPREREVFTLVTRGLANKVMAGELGVSQRTVEIHRARVMEKMQADSLAQLVRMSLQLAEVSENPA